jgi:hypothetical protein
MLEGVLYEDAVQIQHSLTNYLKRENCKQLETLQYSCIKRYFYPHGIKVKPWTRNPYLSHTNSVGDVDLAKDELTNLKTKSYYNLKP